MVFNAFLGGKNPNPIEMKTQIKLNSETTLSKMKLSFKFYRVLLICKYKDTHLVLCKHIFFSTWKIFLGGIWEYGVFICFSWISLTVG